MDKFLLILGVLGVVLSGCSDNRNLKLATTTSTENSELLDHLIPVFTNETGITVKVIAVGTGKAIKLGENGDVDVILVHAREAEDKFVKDGFGVNRKDVMHNDFILIGRPEDAAGIKKAKTVVEALHLIAQKEANFFSRGDDSANAQRSSGGRSLGSSRNRACRKMV